MADLAEKRKAQLAKQQPGGKPPAKEKKPVASPSKPAPVKRYAPLPPLTEKCGACGSPLKYVPVNSHLKKVACTKQGCTLWRECIRFVPLKEVKGAEGNSSQRKD